MKKFLITFLAVLMCISLIGCEKNVSDTQEKQDAINSTEDKNSDEAEQRYTITSDDTKYVVSNGISSQVYFCEGEKIIGYALYIDYEDSETAKHMYEVYKSSYENQDTVKKLSVDRNYLIIEYVDDYIKDQFGDQTISDIKAAYDILNK